MPLLSKNRLYHRVDRCINFLFTALDSANNDLPAPILFKASAAKKFTTCVISDYSASASSSYIYANLKKDVKNECFSYIKLRSKIRSASPGQAVKNLTKIAIPAIAFVGASMIHRAEANFICRCHNNCNKHQDAHELAKLICYIVCMFFFKDELRG
jgi:hypothetical protein